LRVGLIGFRTTQRTIGPDDGLGTDDFQFFRLRVDSGRKIGLDLTEHPVWNLACYRHRNFGWGLFGQFFLRTLANFQALFESCRRGIRYLDRIRPGIHLSVICRGMTCKKQVQ